MKFIHNKIELNQMKMHSSFAFKCTNCGTLYKVTDFRQHRLQFYKKLLCRKCYSVIVKNQNKLPSKKRVSIIIDITSLSDLKIKAESHELRYRDKIRFICQKCGEQCIVSASSYYKNTNRFRDGLTCLNCHEKMTPKEIATRNKKIETTCVKRYGVKNPMMVSEIANKVSMKLLDRSQEEKDKTVSKIKATKKDRHGDENYNNHELASKTYFKRTGYYNSMYNPKSLAKFKESWRNKTEKEKNIIKEKTKRTNLMNSGYISNLITPEQIIDTKRKKRERYGSESMIRKYNYYGITFDSSWELAVWIYCIDHNIPIVREPCAFEYEDSRGNIKNYTPDFSINGKLVEIKGNHYFKENGTMRSPYTRLHRDSKELTYEEKEYMDDLYERKRQCGLEHGVEFWKESDCKKYLSYITEMYGYRYLKSFKSNNPYNPSYWCFNLIPNGMIQPMYFIPISQQGINPYDIDKDEKYHFVFDNGLTPFDIKRIIK